MNCRGAPPYPIDWVEPPGARFVKGFNHLPARTLAADPSVSGSRRVVFLPSFAIPLSRQSHSRFIERRHAKL